MVFNQIKITNENYLLFSILWRCAASKGNDSVDEVAIWKALDRISGVSLEVVKKLGPWHFDEYLVDEMTYYEANKRLFGVESPQASKALAWLNEAIVSMFD